MWPWKKVKVIQADTKMLSLVGSIIVASLKLIVPKMSEYKPILKFCFVLFVFYKIA